MKARSSAQKRHRLNGGTGSSKGNGGEESREGKSSRNGRSSSGRLARLAPVLVLGVGYLLLVALLLLRLRPMMPEYVVGHPAPAKLVARRAFEIPDPERTHALRQQAAQKAIPVFEERPGVVQAARERLDQLFKAAQILSLESGLSAEERRQRLAEAVDLDPLEPKETLDLLLQYRNYTLLQNTVEELLTQILKDGVVPTHEDWIEVQRHAREGIDLVDAEGRVTRKMQVDAVLDVAAARQEFRRLIAERFNKPEEDEAPRSLAGSLGDRLIEPTLVPSTALWQERRQQEMDKVPPEMVQIQKDQKLIDEGEVILEKITVSTVDSRQVSVGAQRLLDALRQQGGYPGWGQAVARAFLVLVPLLLWGVYVRRYHHAVWRDLTQLSCLLALVVLVVGVGQVLSYLSVALEDNLQHIGYAMPVALVGLVGTLLLGPQLSLFTVLIAVLYGGLLFPRVDFILVALTGGMVAIFSTSRVRRRIDITWAGTKVALAACVVATLLYLSQSNSWTDLRADLHPWMLILIWSLLHGILSVMLAGLLLPVLESLMGVVTDFQLLELGQKTELLKRLEAEAPGTYHHSLNVASLAESAAEAIGANGLLTRVAALYHDIGKLGKPLYFSENQVEPTDKKTHSKLTPSMSRLLICNHIKDGQEMAEEHNLPEFIRDAIAQHHGTTLLTYFYDKALQEDSKAVVNESDYRYPGPRPQTVEMAILMLADSLEGASRSLPAGITQGEVYQFVRKIINQKFMDNQFDECDLTLSDLHRLAEAFSRSLVSLLHRRVAYPRVPLDAEKQDKQVFPESRPQAASPPDEAAAPVGVGAGESQDHPASG